MNTGTLMADNVTVRCPDCGGSRNLSVRQRRRILNQDGDLRCSLCRSNPHPPISTAADREFWLSQYPMDWILETAEMIWGDGE